MPTIEFNTGGAAVNWEVPAGATVVSVLARGPGGAGALGTVAPDVGGGGGGGGGVARTTMPGSQAGDFLGGEVGDVVAGGTDTTIQGPLRITFQSGPYSASPVLIESNGSAFWDVSIPASPMNIYIFVDASGGDYYLEVSDQNGNLGVWTSNTHGASWVQGEPSDVPWGNVSSFGGFFIMGGKGGSAAGATGGAGANSSNFGPIEFTGGNGANGDGAGLFGGGGGAGAGQTSNGANAVNETAGVGANGGGSGGTGATESAATAATHPGGGGAGGSSFETARTLGAVGQIIIEWTVPSGAGMLGGGTTGLISSD